MAQVLVGQPLDTIKVRLQLDHGKFKGAWDCAVQTIQKEGFFALYKGIYIYIYTLRNIASFINKSRYG